MSDHLNEVDQLEAERKRVADEIRKQAARWLCPANGPCACSGSCQERAEELVAALGLSPQPA